MKAVLLGLMFVVFGLNGFLNFLSMRPMPTGLAGQVIVAKQGIDPTDPQS